ncbi:peptidase associated/transthyretin-like domain-containing protein [Chitinophaga filiformis]|uniref:CarboxypepD_reg-like domain-containing protein n=1 Tax=Chitinophaga filiformis TaxID=104663 RepID=A0A1G8A468_CHIFI|nr:hypothetical protein [Chitinophaga filiformis]SDH15666.1 hypothetical protein SAMN04488121_109112 [Chitinophaga filiformis]
MNNNNLFLKTALFVVLVLLAGITKAQVRTVYGTVYERSARYGLSGVSVMSTSGAGTITDSLGRYSIKLPLTDSISFSYLGKATMKIPVKEAPLGRAFDMSLHVDVTTLPTVEIQEKRRSYQLDSIANREEYRKVFDYSPEYISSAGGGVGVNLDALFSMRKIKRMEAFREHLIAIEHDKYVDYRFNKTLIQKLTGLQSPVLDSFMVQYRPTYEMLQSFETEYEYYKYIRDWGNYYQQIWKQDHP